MKKNRIFRVTAQTKRNQKNAAKATKRIKSRVKYSIQYITVCKPGPSKSIVYDKDGKVVSFRKWCEKGKHQKDYITEQGKAAMDENKSIRTAKKELIKSILQKAGYDPTIRYTRKEKKKFTRAVKNNLFVKSKPAISQKIEAPDKKLSAKQFAKEVRNNPLQSKDGLQSGDTAYNLSIKEKPKKRKFRYVIERKSSDDPMRSYDFLTDTFDAKTKEESFKKAAKEAKRFKEDTSFAGIRVQDIEGDNSIIFYSPNKLFAA